jgi:hypothetical protein
MNINDKVARLLDEVSQLDDVIAIGRTGTIEPNPRPGESDIDIFVFCERIPDEETRKAAYQRRAELFADRAMTVCAGGDWGTGDVLDVDGVETMLMYFRMDETVVYLDEVRAGKRTASVDGFYPIGRVATIRSINITHDRTGALTRLRESLAEYPDGLREAMIHAHLRRAYDEEDLGRSVLRKDVLFYHQVLEEALDHYLQILYAVNRTYFPSRKRIEQYIADFAVKPDRCYERLLDVVKLGAAAETIAASVSEWRSLVDDLRSICAAR